MGKNPRLGQYNFNLTRLYTHPIRNRIYVSLPLILVALFHNVVHESLHFLFASLFGEKVLEFRILTNGWGSSQVIFATPIESRRELYWLGIAWAPAVFTTLVGYLLYWKHETLITAQPLVNLFTGHLGALFMTIDPLYLGVFFLVYSGNRCRGCYHSEFAGLAIPHRGSGSFYLQPGPDIPMAF